MKNFKIIAFTHKSADLKEIGKFHMENGLWEEKLGRVKHDLEIEELMFLSTCNRVEFLFWSDKEFDGNFLCRFFKNLYSFWSDDEISWAAEKATIIEGEEALKHFFDVASSIDSLVVGEREIITQVRNSFENSKKNGLVGDNIRLIIRKTIETAKDVYTKTGIANNPVSVVSLACRKLKFLNVLPEARILLVGAGQTNTAMARHLKKHKYKNFSVFNRSLENAQKLADEVKGKAFPLKDLSSYSGGFDVLISCTGSSEIIINEEVYAKLICGETNKKIVIDLAIPNDFESSICEKFPVHLIEIESLKAIANENMEKRHKELDACKKIIETSLLEFKDMFKTRQIERAMSEVPKKVREIKAMATGTVFAKELETLDDHSREILEQVLSYMEKKYISMPMKMAKEILLEEKSKF